MTSAISTGTSTSLIAVIAVFAYFHEPTSNGVWAVRCGIHETADLG
jgi:hypothetical protein